MKKTVKKLWVSVITWACLGSPLPSSPSPRCFPSTRLRNVRRGETAAHIVVSAGERGVASWPWLRLLHWLEHVLDPYPNCRIIWRRRRRRPLGRGWARLLTASRSAFRFAPPTAAFRAPLAPALGLSTPLQWCKHCRFKDQGWRRFPYRGLKGLQKPPYVILRPFFFEGFEFGLKSTVKTPVSGNALPALGMKPKREKYALWLFFKIDLCSALSFKRSWWELSIDVAEHRCWKIREWCVFGYFSR